MESQLGVIVNHDLQGVLNETMIKSPDIEQIITRSSSTSSSFLTASVSTDAESNTLLAPVIRIWTVLLVLASRKRSAVSIDRRCHNHLNFETNSRVEKHSDLMNSSSRHVNH